MRFRTLALALALACGMTAMAEARQTKQKAVVHHTAKKATVRRGKTMKANQARRARTAAKAAKHTKTRHKTSA